MKAETKDNLEILLNLLIERKYLKISDVMTRFNKSYKTAEGYLNNLILNHDVNVYNFTSKYRIYYIGELSEEKKQDMIAIKEKIRNSNTGEARNIYLNKPLLEKVCLSAKHIGITETKLLQRVIFENIDKYI